MIAVQDRPDVHTTVLASLRTEAVSASIHAFASIFRGECLTCCLAAWS